MLRERHGAMKRVLMIAYHFPPLSGSSGIQRTLRFVRYLPEFEWQPIVLTSQTRAYERTSDDQLCDIPANVQVIRAPAWDTSRHLAIAGRYPAFLARPDRWVSWWPGATWQGMRTIWRLKPDIIWSTYPIATSHLIAATLSRISGLPWVADFRDPMAQPDYPLDPITWRHFDAIERRTVTRARFSTFTTPSAASTYRERYPQRADSILLLENGYDEEAFDVAAPNTPLNPGKLTLLHSGVVYPQERDPTHLFGALSKLKQLRPDLSSRLVLRFRAPAHESMLTEIAERLDVAELIDIQPPIGYRDALREMLNADGLLILQASNCNSQVPAKLYEYMRARRPVLVFTDPAGDTAAVARCAGIHDIAPLNDTDEIAALLSQFIGQPGVVALPDAAVVAGASRRERTRELASVLESATAGE